MLGPAKTLLKRIPPMGGMTAAARRPPLQRSTSRASRRLPLGQRPAGSQRPARLGRQSCARRCDAPSPDAAARTVSRASGPQCSIEGVQGSRVFTAVSTFEQSQRPHMPGVWWPYVAGAERAEQQLSIYTLTRQLSG